MDRFPALRLILKFGRLWALLVAVLATVAVMALLTSLYPAAGWIAWAAAPLSLIFFYFLAKSYVELIQIVVEMVH